MSSTGLPDDVCRFVDAHLPTVEHVDAFLLLARVSPESRSAAELAMELRVPVTETADRLEHMRGTALLSVVNVHGAEPRYQWTAHSRLEAETVERLHTLYRVRPVSLIRYVYERPRNVAQQFADAFRMRKDRK